MAPAALKDEGLGAEAGRLAAGSADSLDGTSGDAANRPFCSPGALQKSCSSLC